MNEDVLKSGDDLKSENYKKIKGKKNDLKMKMTSEMSTSEEMNTISIII